MVLQSAKARVAALLFLASFLLVLPLKAGAITILPNPVVITDGTNYTTQITLIDVYAGSMLPSGATQLTGTTGSTDQVLVFQLSVTAGTGAIKDLSLTARTPVSPPPFTYYTPTGTGTIADVPDINVNVTDGGASLPTVRFNFGSPGVGVPSGQSSDLFFVSYASGTLTGINQAIQFAVDPVSGGNKSAGALVIPEPGTLLLLGLGLLGTRLTRWRRG
jgi:hypothetical protein